MADKTVPDKDRMGPGTLAQVALAVVSGIGCGVYIVLGFTVSPALWVLAAIFLGAAVFTVYLATHLVTY